MKPAKALANLRVWPKAIRVHFLTATIIPVVLGSTIAWHDAGSFIWLRFLLALLGASLVHAGTNMMNDYFDHLTRCDEINRTPTPFSGGSRVIQEGLLGPRTVLRASLVSFALGGAIGIYLNHVSGGNVILILGAIGFFLGVFHSVRQFKIGYGGFGELAVGIGFGPLMVMGSYYTQAQELPLRIFLVSIPVGLLIACVLLINEFPDYLADKTVGKRTLVVILGKRKAVIVFNSMVAAAYLLVVIYAVSGLVPLLCLITLVSVPLAVKAFVVSSRNYESVVELLPANASTIALHSAVGLLVFAGYLLDKLL